MRHHSQNSKNKKGEDDSIFPSGWHCNMKRHRRRNIERSNNVARDPSESNEMSKSQDAGVIVEARKVLRVANHPQESQCKTERRKSKIQQRENPRRQFPVSIDSVLQDSKRLLRSSEVFV